MHRGYVFKIITLNIGVNGTVHDTVHDICSPHNKKNRNK